MARRPCIQWLLRFGGFLGLLLLTQFAARWLGLGYWQPVVNNQALKMYLYQLDGLAPDILFLGTSKVNRAVIPAVVEEGQGSVFCLGQRGMGLQAQAIVLRDVLRTNGRPRLVVLEITPAMLNANHGGFRDVLRFYASPSDLVRAVPRLRTPAAWRAAGQGVFRGMTSLYLRAWSRILHGGQERQLASIRRLKGGRYDPVPPEGMQRLSDLTVGEQQDLLGKIREEGRRSYMRHYEIGGMATEGLEQIIRLTRRQGIGLVLFNPPVTRAYRRAMYRPDEYARYLRYVEEISRREGIPFHDLDDGRLQLTPADFHDFGHLNAAGAEKVSRYMARDLLGPALESPPVPGRAGIWPVPTSASQNR